MTGVSTCLRDEGQNRAAQIQAHFGQYCQYCAQPHCNSTPARVLSITRTDYHWIQQVLGIVYSR